MSAWAFGMPPTVKRCPETRAHYAHEWYTPLRAQCPGGPEETPEGGVVLAQQLEQATTPSGTATPRSPVLARDAVESGSPPVPGSTVSATDSRDSGGSPAGRDHAGGWPLTAARVGPLSPGAGGCASTPPLPASDPGAVV